MRKKYYIKLVLLFIILLMVFFAYIFLNKKIDNYDNDYSLDLNNEKNLENINNESSAIIHNIVQNQTINSPLIINGRARGTWFFEASFPIRLLDVNYNEIAVGIAQAKTDWMTSDFVEFETTIYFTKPNLESGFVVFEKDNPSGLPEYEEKIYIPIKYQ